jgi:hypothetical protein
LSSKVLNVRKRERERERERERQLYKKLTGRTIIN